MIKQYLNKGCIWLNQEHIDKESLFASCSKELEKLNLVSPEYLQALLEREKNFPTGLQMEKYAVAIPHADPEVINNDFIAVVTLKQPIRMHCMEDMEKEIDISIFFLLGLKDGESHLAILREFISLIQIPEAIKKIQEAVNENDVINVIEQYSQN